MVRPVQSGDWAYVLRGKKKDGFSAGDIFYVAGIKVLPVKEGDPYLQRIFVYGCKEKDILGEETSFPLYVVDPRQLNLVGEDKAKELEDNRLEKYAAAYQKHLESQSAAAN